MQEFRYQLKHMGILFYIPIFVAAIILPFILLVPDNVQNHLFISLEFIIVPISSWWSIYLVYYFYHQGAEEVLQHFFVKNLFLNHLKFLGIFMGIIFILVILFSVRFNANFPSLFLLFTGQSILFSTLGLLLAVTFKDVQTAIVVLTLYTSTEIITYGELLPGLHLFFFQMPSSMRDITTYFIFSVLIALVMAAITYKVGTKMERNII